MSKYVSKYFQEGDNMPRIDFLLSDLIFSVDDAKRTLSLQKAFNNIIKN